MNGRVLRLGDTVMLVLMMNDYDGDNDVSEPSLG